MLALPLAKKLPRRGAALFQKTVLCMAENLFMLAAINIVAFLGG